uniref:Mucin 2, oligomeric mucus/gel-forming n=1 Tax=Malurus cyaneus samueli TaxID=2593467 RepID=A0A8C5TN48_9PASS
ENSLQQKCYTTPCHLGSHPRASNGVMLIWDKKTTVFIKLSPDYKGKVCGLCGNFDDKSNNDFTARSGLQDTNPLKFGNSWKQSPMCPDVTGEIKPCDLKPHRKSWAEKECSIIHSEVFKICHSKVNPHPFYEACVHDACSCDSGGDCECFCSAVAAYAQECTKAEACVFWRTPDICPIFCDYYNPPDECEWHYEPCGSNITTCRMINNVSTNFTVPLLEGNKFLAIFYCVLYNFVQVSFNNYRVVSKLDEMLLNLLY